MDKLEHLSLKYDFLAVPVKIILVILMAILLVKIIKKITNNSLKRNQKLAENPQAVTITKVIANVARYVIYFIAIVIILALLNINIGPIIASAGIVGVAIGFGAQSLVKDIIGGFFIIFDKYFAVGDYIETNGVSGFVEELGLRSTKIKDWGGEVHIFPNGEITKVTNYSLGSLSSFLEIPIAYSGDLDQGLAVIGQACQSIKEDFGDMLTDGPSVLGLDKLDKDRMLIKIYLNTPLAHRFQVTREMRKRAKDYLDKAGIAVAPSYRILVETETLEVKNNVSQRS